MLGLLEEDPAGRACRPAELDVVGQGCADLPPWTIASKKHGFLMRGLRPKDASNGSAAKPLDAMAERW